MPSGSKRRKAAAAKKKQDKGSNFNTSSTASPENDDPKIVEGDDDVEVSSLVPDEKRGDSSVRLIVDEKTLEEDGAEDYDGGAAVVADGGVNGEEESESKNGGAVNDESAKNCHTRSPSSSSSSSSSDDEARVVEESELTDESQVVKNNSVELEDESRVVGKNVLELEDESRDTNTVPLELEDESQGVEKNPLGLEDGSQVTETVPLELEDESQVTEKDPLESENSEKLNNEGESLIPDMTTVSDYTPTEDVLYNSVVETEPLDDSANKLDETMLEKVIPHAQIYPLETSMISDVVELGINEKDDHFTDYAKDDQAIEDAKDVHDDTNNTSTEEAHYVSVTETAPIVDSVKLDDPILEKVIPITGTNEKVDQLIPSLAESENNGTFGFVTDIEPEKVEDKALPLSYKKNERGSSSANAPISGTKNRGKDIKYSEVAECSEEQPLIDHPPEQVQKASWKNCCGLFHW